MVPSTNFDLWRYTRGNRNGRVLLIGEAWGQYERAAKSPFVGPSGMELSRMLHEAGINELEVCFTNIVDEQPPGNEFTHFLTRTRERGGIQFRGLHCKQVLLDGIVKVQKQIAEMKPKLIIGAGNVPLWALTSHGSVSSSEGYKVPAGIMKWRGSQVYTNCTGGAIPYLPIIHPAAILRSYDLRYPTVHDLKARAARFLNEKTEWREPIYPTNHAPKPNDVTYYLKSWIAKADAGPLYLSIDIETYRQNTIACIGIADDDLALCIPLFYFAAGSGGASGTLREYFSEADEVAILLLFRNLMLHPNLRIIGQNYNYDQQYFWRQLCIKPRLHWDTMIAHHLMFPGTPKGLSYLASLYSDHYVYWKDESQDWADGVSHENLWLYNCKDVRYTYEIAMEQMKLIPKLNLTEQLKCQLQQWELAAEMTRRGVNMNVDARLQLSKELTVIASELYDYLLRCVPADTRHSSGGTPWFTSPKLTMDILYRQLQIAPVLHKKTKKPTCDAGAIPVLRKRAPWLAPVFDRLESLRSISVFKSHFLDAKLSFDNRIRCSFTIGGTDTFRWSSSANSYGEGTNLQNIPKGDEE